ncbi:glycosyltransferase [Rhodoblastus acidophilus]|uniref:Glycosyltransferase n=1 Tax=Candidatus Rhodoblastus alkanivorans TaxID=2954117 RepID=A0ABS9Z9G2_9HYPH|nr:glycosyltransferase [Candidatus Rhodoblastus alkanivorans]MCI4684329.1 glycosyltransferase [Candidatus Rhodoblastus alkanivorans]
MRNFDDMPLCEPSLRILHVLRAPVGGLFRHVLDLAQEQAARGHAVGLIADSRTGGETADRRLARIAPLLRLGVVRLPMRRKPHASDLPAIARVCREIARLKPDVVHGHGSKGGLYARASGFVPGLGDPLRVYTPHGGSFHQQPGRALYMAVERVVASQTDLLLFESEFIAREYAKGVGPTRALRRIARNGLLPNEFAPVAAAPEGAEFLYVGELSAYKGVDTLIEALAALHRSGAAKARLAIVGSGCELARLAAIVEHYDLNRHVAFHGALPARDAFALGRIVVAPSRAESLPYIVMEAIAADKTVIATDVGGVAEIFGPLRDRLIPRDDPAALARAMAAALRRDPADAAAERAALSRQVATHFSVKVMADSALAAYAQGLSRKGRAPAALSEAAI